MRLENYPLTCPAVHNYADRRIEAQMADAAVFRHSRLLAQPFPIHRTFTSIGINGKISDLECGEILKEMTALGGHDTKITEAGLDDDAGTGDFIPLDRNTE